MLENTCIRCGRIIPEGEYQCLHCGDYDDMQTFKPSLRANYPEPYVPPKKTNGDRIRAMNNAELAQYLETTERRALFTDGVTSARSWRKWLESEAET